MRVRTRTWFSFVVAVSVLFIVASQFGVFDPLDSAVARQSLSRSSPAFATRRSRWQILSTT